jgi:hypothetical protein
MPVTLESLYSNPGKVARGRVGVTGSNDKYGSGMIIAGRASKAGQFLTCPRFVYTTTTCHKREGGGTARAPFLALRIEHVPNRPDLIQLRGLWLHSSEGFKKAFNTASMSKTDPVSARSIAELRPDSGILDTQWHDNIGYMKVELSIRVYREHVTTVDPDALHLTHVVRRHLYGQSKSWPRLESIERLLGPNWTLEALLASRISPDPTFSPPPPPSIIGGTASGLDPVEPSFPSVDKNIFYLRNLTVRVGGQPGGIMHCVQHAQEDAPELAPAILFLDSRPTTETEPLTGTSILELRDIMGPAQLKELQARPAPPTLEPVAVTSPPPAYPPHPPTPTYRRGAGASSTSSTPGRRLWFGRRT